MGDNQGWESINQKIYEPLIPAEPDAPSGDMIGCTPFKFELFLLDSIIVVLISMLIYSCFLEIIH